jgi:hypothetical protein
MCGHTYSHVIPSIMLLSRGFHAEMKHACQLVPTIQSGNSDL